MKLIPYVTATIIIWVVTTFVTAAIVQEQENAGMEAMVVRALGLFAWLTTLCMRDAEPSKGRGCSSSLGRQPCPSRLST